MKNTDQHISEIFSNKLSGFESDVNPNLWAGIESALPQAGAGTTAAVTGAKILTAKTIWIAAASVLAIATSVYFFVTNGELPTTQSKPVQEALESNLAKKDEEVSTVNQADISSHSNSSSAIEENNGSLVSTPETGKAQNENPSVSPANDAGIVDHSSDGVSGSKPGINDGKKTSDEQVTTPDMIRGGSQLPPPPRAFNAEFNAIQVNEDDLKFFFFPQFPEEQSYQWEIDGQLSGTDITTSFTFAEEGTHEVKLIVLNHRGESKTFTSEIEAYLEGELVLQTIITPNGDDKNSFFNPAALSKNVAIESLRIVDANNQLVHESTGALLNWDGTDRFGEPLPPATYFADVSARDHRGKVIRKQEFVTLRR
ncbi:MAG: gliding motility-associated C-terminal domain-containing protein [Flavobacteriales bacterium]|nr:gliding motility-associated C-terminal domain-containing protein [Flavobacteriales bacterium]